MQDTLWRAGRWLFGAGLFVAAAYVVKVQLLDRYVPQAVSIDPALPEFFRATEWRFWIWYVGLTTLAVLVGGWALYQGRRWRSGEAAGSDAEAVATAEEAEAIRSAWSRIVTDLKIGPETLVYLAFAPTGQQVASLLDAAGLGSANRAPDPEAEPDAPIRGIATEDEVVIWCGGRPARTAAFVAEELGRIAPACPKLRGIVAIYPAESLDGALATELTTAYRATARALAGASAVRCPLVVVVTGMDRQPGFLEFAGRMPRGFRDSKRFGFSIPKGGRASTPGDLAAGYDELLQWYDRRILGLLADAPTAQEGNVELHGLGRRLRLWRKRLLAALEALACLDADDPFELTGCYFAADGTDPSAWACAAAVLQGQVVGDPQSARWSVAALEADRARRRQALWVATVGMLLVAAVWAYTFLGLERRHPVTWLALAATAAAWGYSAWDWIRLDRPRDR